jgi:hypothetical protein
MKNGITPKISLKRLNSQAQGDSTLLQKLVLAVAKQEVAKACEIMDGMLKDIGNYEWLNLLSITVSTSNREMIREMFYRKPILKRADFFSLLTNAAQKNNPALFDSLCNAYQTQTGHFLELDMKDLPLIRIAASGDVEKFQEELAKYPNQENIRWQLILDASAHNGHRNMFDCAFSLTPNKNEIDWSNIVSGVVKSGDESIFDYVFEKIPNEFFGHTKSAISNIPHHVDNLEVFKILQNFSKQFSKKIEKHPQIEDLEIEINPKRHDALRDLSAVYRTSKTLHDTIEFMIGNEEAPSASIEINSADKLSQLPQDVREEIVGFLSK